MPKVSPKIRKFSKRTKLLDVPKKEENPEAGQATKRGTQDEAIAKILEGAAKRGEGRRILLLGATRKGKTYFAKKLVKAMLQTRVANLALIHDQKNPDVIQYDGIAANTPQELQDLILKGERQIVCRSGVSVEDAAKAECEAVVCGVSTVLHIDEVTPALRVNPDTYEPMPRIWAGPSPIWILLQGGGLGASIVMNAQLPLYVPGAMMDNSQVYVFFGLGGRSLEYAHDSHLLPREAIQTVKMLGEGELCTFWSELEWDRTIYGPK